MSELINEGLEKFESSIISEIEELKSIQKKFIMQNVIKDEEVIRVYKEKISTLEQENIQNKNEIKVLKHIENNFVKNLIGILDELERLKGYGKLSGNEKLIETLERNFKVIKKYLLEMDIQEIPTEKMLFNENYHNCVDVAFDEEKDDFEVIEEIKKGYVYKGNVVRASEVIINRI